MNAPSLSSKKSSLQKVFGLNLHLKNKEIEFNPLPPYQYIRASRENFSETDPALKLECLLKQACTYFIKNSGETLNVNADSVLRKRFLGK
jgi:hypothetical protein